MSLCKQHGRLDSAEIAASKQSVMKAQWIDVLCRLGASQHTFVFAQTAHEIIAYFN
jgi:hypothetical protein